MIALLIPVLFITLCITMVNTQESWLPSVNFDTVPIFEFNQFQYLKYYGEEKLRQSEHRGKREISWNARNKNMKKWSRLTVETLLLIDHSIYEHFLRLSSNDSYSAETAIGQYFLRIMEETNRMYMGLQFESIKIRIRPSGIIISKNVNESGWLFPWNTSNDADALNTTLLNEDNPERDSYTLLKYLSRWVLENHAHLPINDHVIAFTREDLRRSGDDLAQGIAYVKSICKRGESVSLVEDIGAMGSVAVVAHELAHSLGADHDGTSVNRACPHEHNFLMGPSVGGTKKHRNTFRFSNCTINQISQYLDENKKSTSCLQRISLNLLGNSNSRRKRDIPGQVYDATKQCQLTFDAKFRFCGDQDYYLTQLCHRLWCRNVTQSRYAPCYTKHYLPAFYGTSCGHKMWCVNGACVEDKRAPANTKCSFGDRDSTFCINLITIKPQSCKYKTFNRFCCNSCNNWKVFRRVRI